MKPSRLWTPLFLTAIAISIVGAVAQTNTQDFEGWTVDIGGDGFSTIPRFTNDNWIVNDGYPSEYYTDSESLLLTGETDGGTAYTNSYIETDLLPYGLGSLSFKCQNEGGAASIEIHVLSSTDRTNWGVVATNYCTSADWQTKQVVFDDETAVYLRIYKATITGNDSYQHLSIDDVTITDAPAKVTFQNTQTTPGTPEINDTVDVSTEIIPSSQASNIVATLHYWYGVTSNSISMTTNATPNGYTTTSPIPGLGAGLTVNYRVEATFDGYNAHSPTNTADSYTIVERPFLTDYEDINLTGSGITNLVTVDDYTWEGVLEPSTPLSGASFFFEGFTNEAHTTTNTWGDNSQSLTALPIKDTGDLDGAAIAVDSMSTGQFAFVFSETNAYFEISEVAFQSFDGWMGAESYGTHTFNGWKAANSSIQIPADSLRKLRLRTCILESNTTAYVRSPNIPAGVGTIQFWYRNWETNGPTTECLIQTSPTGGDDPAEWTTADTIPAILSPAYNRHTLTLNDTSSHYVRLLNATNQVGTRLCIDELMISVPDRGVVFSNLTHSPQIVTVTNDVFVSVDMAAVAHSSNLQPTLFYRPGTSGPYDSVSMTDTGTLQFISSSPIAKGQEGIMQYYVECSYEDPFESGLAYATSPFDGANNPASYTNEFLFAAFTDFQGWADAIGGDHFTPIPRFTNEGWIVNDGYPSIYYTPPTYTNEILLLAGEVDSGTAYTNAYIETGLLSSGVGTLRYECKNEGGAASTDIHILYSTNGTTWLAKATNQCTSANWQTNQIVFNASTPMYLRIYKATISGNDSYQHLSLDNVTITFPPAFVTIGAPDIAPAYPSASDSVYISCVIVSATTHFPAFSIGGTLHYRYDGAGDFTAISMERTGSNFVTSTGIPAAPAGTIVEYYIESDFAGYAYGDEDNSPMYYPSAGATEPLSYTLRHNSSDYGAIRATVNGEALAMRQYEDNKWQAVISFPTNMLNPLIAAEGLGYNDGSGYSETPVQWGDSSQTSSNLPLMGSMQIGGSTIELDGTYRGQYVLRFDEATLEYLLISCAFNDFDTWPANPSFFEESRDAISKGYHDEDFDDWDLSVPDRRGSDFESGWPTLTASDYPPDPTDFGSGRGSGDYLNWVIENATIIPQKPMEDHLYALELADTPNQGVVRLEKDGPLDGIGTVSFDYRCVNHDRPVAVYTNSIGWTNMAVTVRLRATETATGRGSVGDSWLSVYPRYVDANNFYELRIERALGDTTKLSLYRTKSGSGASLLTTTTSAKSITSETSYRICIDNHTETEEIEFIVYDGNTVMFEYADATGSGVVNPGYIAISSLDASVAVVEVTGGPGVMQSFTGWPNVLDHTTITPSDDWTATWCRIEDAQARIDKYNAARSPGPELSNLQAPKLPHGIGTIRFRAKKTNGQRASLLLQYSDTGGTNPAEWTTFDSRQINSQSYNAYNIVADLTNAYFRFANTNYLTYTPAYVWIDGIVIEPATNSTEYLDEDFQDSMAQGWSDGVGAWGLTSNNVYYLEGYNADPLSFEIQTASATNYSYLDLDTSWSTETTNAGLYNTAYDRFTYAVNNADAAYARVKHTTGEGHLIINNISNESWRGETVLSEGWMATAAWVIGPETNKYTNSIELTNTRMASVEDQAIRSPYLEEGCELIRFSYRNLSTITSAVFAVERTNPGDTNSWNTASPVALITNLTPAANMNLATGWTNESFNVDAGDPLFVRIRQVSTHEDAGILIDDVTVSEQVETNEFTWFAYNGLISNLQEDRLLWEQSGNEQGAYLNHVYGPTNDTPEMLGADMPYIQTGYLSNGVGRINFHYRAWEPSEQATLVLRMAPSRETPKYEWITLRTITVSNDVFAVFDEDFYSETNHYVRIYTEITNGSARACIDNAMVMAPIGAYLNIRDLTISPELPLAGDLVSVRAVVTNFFLDPSNITMTTYYHTNTAEWGSFDNAWERSMSIVESNSSFIAFETTVPLPTQDIDTVVQYAVKASYDGRWSEVSSPKESREFTTPEWHCPADLNAGKAQSVPHYVVFSCGTNDVWINELNLLGFAYDPREYIELCGRTDVNIGNWTVEVFPASYTTQALYSIAAGTSFAAETNGFGFWVLGNSSTATRDMLLSSALPATGGIRLMRGMGALVDAVCYDSYGEGGHPLLSDSSYGFRDIGSDVAWVSAPLGLVGTGGDSSNFEWSNNESNSYSPGIINFSQVLQGSNPVAPFTSNISISNLWTDASTIYMDVMADTDSLGPTPWYTTNLLHGIGWVEGSNATYTHTGNTYTVWFDRVTNAPYCFYRITATNSP